jgi:hypothetical protein
MPFVRKLETRNSKIEARNSKQVGSRGWLCEFRISNFEFRSRILAAVAGLVAFACSSAAWAQSCPMCYRAAAAAKGGALQALRSGILILMIPPVLIVGGIAVLAVRGRNRFNDASGPDSAVEPILEPIDDRELNEWLASTPPNDAGDIEPERSERRSSES